MPERPVVSAIVLAYGAEPYLHECIAALADDPAVDEILLVDNGCTTDAVAAVRDLAKVELLLPGRNTGFTGGCNLAATKARGSILVLVNSDAIAMPDAVARLTARCSRPEVGLVTASVRLAGEPDLVNTAGNPVHLSGLSWAGGLGEPASEHGASVGVTSASGCAMAVRREVWEQLGGFYEELFAYLEDTDLSLRCWQAGLRVEYEPEAVVLHHYEFSRNPQKLYLLERNRLLMVLTVYDARLLALLALPLLGFELAMAAVALKQGWFSQKFRGWWWLVAHAGVVAARRRQVQAARSPQGVEVATLLTPDFTPGGDLPGAQALTSLSRSYWTVTRRVALRHYKENPNVSENRPLDTQGRAYTDRLSTKESAWWKRLLKVQAIYQWNVRRLDLGKTLDIECGLGRNLESLGAGSVGLGHNAQSVELARSRGLPAMTVEEFAASDLAVPGAFDSLLLAHVIEHLSRQQAQELVEAYLHYLRPGGRVVFICPQERGSASDPTHVTWTDAATLMDLGRACGLTTLSAQSFPLPRATGKAFIYNEFVVVCRSAIAV